MIRHGSKVSIPVMNWEVPLSPCHSTIERNTEVSQPRCEISETKVWPFPVFISRFDNTPADCQIFHLYKF